MWTLQPMAKLAGRHGRLRKGLAGERFSRLFFCLRYPGYADASQPWHFRGGLL